MDGRLDAVVVGVGTSGTITGLTRYFRDKAPGVEIVLADPRGSATALAGFISELQAIDASAGPLPGRHNASRGVPLVARDRITRDGIAAMEGLIDTHLATIVWEDALSAPVWDQPAVWIHGDLHPANVLHRNGRIEGVIDFGCLGVGDPAYDVSAAWTLFDPAGREHVRDVLDVDAATWRRARGWALSFGVMVFPYYRDTNPGLVEIAHFTITQALADVSAR